MEISIRRNHELRLKAFDLLQELKSKNVDRKEITNRLYTEFGINRGTLIQWYDGDYIPYGRKGELIFNPELFYVLGALLGDGCVYNWKITQNYVILIGDYNFTTKFANMIYQCTGTKIKAYIDRSKNIWFVRYNNFKLYSLFKNIRVNLGHLKELIKDKKSALLFVEGFFDAEGCIKIVKEESRKTPKICLDITNTNFEIQELVKKLLKDNLNIEAKYSNQEYFVGKDGSIRKKVYHLRIYKKGYIKIFFENIKTIKLYSDKIPYVENWLKTKNKTTLQLDCSFLQPASN
ncbi:MAG TPA: LAGLIDADG family homing endonuclease [Candidatus Nanoarchaeia archaeon]|nr:LAGLIDADG family homing endonuclease [Candidatus Nanoarchaeia archaeon]